MEPLTYKLNLNETTASPYYTSIALFTNNLLSHAEQNITPIAKKYRQYLIGYQLEEPRTVEEYTYELLNLGVLWKAYGTTATGITFAPFHFMARMGEWRKTYPRLKPIIDLVRGIILSLFLAPSPMQRTENAPQTLNDLDRLVIWLEATGDFREDAFRYIRWLGYFGTLPKEFVPMIMEKVLAFTDWFESESITKLGMYTPHVDSFLVNNSSRYRWREDRFSCLRSRMEYHLNMVGAEIMNRAYRKEFLACKKKTVLLPGCMRMRSEDRCEGVKTKKGIICTGCESKCRINQIRETGKRNNFDVMVIPHSTDLAQWKSKPEETPSAVVGVACLSVLVQGGWELQRNNVPAQCILLNECGCKKHWHKNGFPTSIDVRELKRVIQN